MCVCVCVCVCARVRASAHTSVRGVRMSMRAGLCACARFVTCANFFAVFFNLKLSNVQLHSTAQRGRTVQCLMIRNRPSAPGRASSIVQSAGCGRRRRWNHRRPAFAAAAAAATIITCRPSSPPSAVTAAVAAGHNYIGHNYIRHTYVGHTCIGHTYIGHYCCCCRCSISASPTAAAAATATSARRPNLRRRCHHRCRCRGRYHRFVLLALYRLYLGIADGTPISVQWTCRY